MTRLFRPAVSLCLLTLLLPAQTIDVGSGSPSEAVRLDFQRAYFRNGFNSLTSLPPSGNVARYGSSGYRQEFPDAAKTANVKYALIRNTTTNTSPAEGSENTFQMYPDLYTYYQTVGSNTAGYPSMDTARCPQLSSNSCTYQLFDKNYALFVYASDNGNGTTFTSKDPFFTRWRALGGIGTLGPAINAEETGTSGAGTAATVTAQKFVYGGLYNITAGTFNGRLYSVRTPIYEVYLANNGHLGFLGLPTNEETTLTNGLHRQTFEGGAIEYTVGSTPVLRLPVSTISLSVTPAAQSLNLGDTVKISVSLYSANGTPLDGRVVNWTSSNPKVLTVESSGMTVTARAVGGGTATVTAVSEGQSSRAITFFVSAPCCQIGEGAPTPSIQQAFVDAVSRNRLNLKVPAPGPVRRLGNGYVQDAQPADASSTVRYLLAKPDTLASAFVITGSILAHYLDLNGPVGPLGYPTVDANAAGRQLFEGGALAGNPPQLVSGAILTRWATQGYETGAAGLPTSAPTSVLSFAATIGTAQAFTKSAIYSHSSGSFNGRAFLVSGIIFNKYSSLGDAAGKFGLPTADEYTSAGRRRQDFEGGTIDYAPGDAEATATERGRRAQISANPSTVVPGARVRIAAGGFDAGATLRITVGNQPDFTVTTQTGAYAWESYIPANAAAGLVTLRAADVNGTAIAAGSYLVQATSEVLTRVTKLSGDLQTGLPGARLSLPIRITVKDDNATPLRGVAVRFNPSPGAQIESADALTDDSGVAQAFLRLPMAEGPALATAEAGGQVVTFSARTQASTLSNFPKFTAPKPGDALLTTSAAIVRYLQSAAQASTQNGLADAETLRTFLTNFCQFDPSGAKVCDGFLGATVNLWRLAAFTGGSLDPTLIEASPSAIRDSLAAGSPVLLAISYPAPDATRAATHFIAAIGVSSNGGIVIQDSVAALQQPTLDSYLTAGRTIAAAIQLRSRATSTLGFLITSAQPAPVSSAAGLCGAEIVWPDSPYTASQPAWTSSLLRQRFCDGAQSAYQAEPAAAATLYSLGSVASQTSLTAGAASRLVRPDAVWIATAQSLTFAAGSVLNAASYQPNLAPGTLAAIFGQGLAAANQDTTVELDNVPAPVLAATGFQVNFAIPANVTPGAHSLRVTSRYGSQEQAVQLAAVAPAIFLMGSGRGAVVNASGLLNTPTTPAQRGGVVVVYATGLGSLIPQGDLQVAENKVTATVGGATVDVLFAGAAPGFTGLNQINLRLPASIPPGIDLPLTIEQTGTRSQPVLVSIQ